MKCAVIALTIIALAQKAVSIRCYLGTGNPDNVTNTVSCIGTCVKIYNKLKSPETSIYGCFDIRTEDGCEEIPALGPNSEICHCNSSFCNGSASWRLALPLLALALILGVVALQK